MATKYKIFLTPEERLELGDIAKKGKRVARVVLMALALLFST
jgi:hypothetical protein